MKLQAACDVENVSDFKKYYEGAYVECRDGNILKLDRVIIDTEQVIYRTINSDILNATAQPMGICTWQQMSTMMVFGKIGVGMCDLYGRIRYNYQLNNRTGSRGYHAEEYQSEIVGGTMDPAVHRAASISPIESAWADVCAHRTMRPRYGKVSDLSIASTHGVALSPLWAIVPEHKDKTKTPRFKVFRRREHVGWYNVNKQTILFGPTEYKQYAQYLTNRLGVECSERKA